jgi:hypothetical protein
VNPGCAHFEPELSAYLDGELDAAERARLDAHLHACARCAAELRELRRVGESLRRWDAQETRYAQSTGFRNRVLARVGGHADAPVEEIRTWRRAAWAAAAAAGVVGAFAWATTRPAAVGGADLDDLRARVEAVERSVASLPAGEHGAHDATGAARADLPDRIGDIPPIVGPAARASVASVPEDERDPWEARGDGMLLRDAVPEYERFVNERRRLSIEERLARVERKDTGSGATATVAAPAPTPLGALLAQASVSTTHFPPFERVQVWPIEMSNAPRGPRPLLLEAAIDERAVAVTEDAQGNVVAENSDLKGRSVLLLAGDVIRGGRCDRVLRESVLLAPGRRMSLPVFGASTVRAGTTYRSFTRSRLLAPADLRALLAAGALGESVAQRDVDDTVRSSLLDLGSPGGESSLENLWTNSELQREVSRYVEAFRKRLDRPNVVGFALAAGGEIVGVEICGDTESFRALRDRLVRSHVLSALSRSGDEFLGAPPPDAAVQAVVAAACRAVFDEPAGSGDGTLGLFRSLDGGVFGAGLLDGTHVVHASIFAGLPEPGAGAAARGARGPLGRGPTAPGAGSRRPAPAPDRTGGSGPGGGIDSR